MELFSGAVLAHLVEVFGVNLILSGAKVGYGATLR